MKVEKIGEKTIVHLPMGLCPYSQAADEFIAEMGQLVSTAHAMSPGPDRGIILFQDGPAADWHEHWINELHDSCLFNDLVHRIDAWRWLLSMIRNSPVPWTYAAADDCFGGFWELALSCHHRYWFKSASKIGFPEIQVGVFPPGGVLESLSKRTGRTRERWQANPYYAADVALSDGLIDFCSDAQEWRNQAILIFTSLLRADPTSGVRVQRRARERDQFVSVDAQSRRAAYQQIETVWRQEKFGGAAGPTAWDYCWQLISERARLRQPSDLGKIVSLIASRYMLLPNYLTWLQSRRVEFATNRLQKATHSIAIPPLTIDLNHGIPPNLVVAKALEARQQLVFVAADNRDLVSSLNLIFNRLERSLGNVTAQYLWEHGVTWCQGRPRGQTAPVLSWTHDDFMIVSIGGKEYRFLRLEGNGSTAGAGLLEFTGDASTIPRLVIGIVNFLSDQIIATPFILPNQQPLTLLVRSFFLDELIRISGKTDGDLSVAVSGLNQAGWRFAGAEESWDRFLRIRQTPSPNPNGSSPRIYNADLTTWRLAKNEAKKQKNPNDSRINHIELSHHMALYLGTLGQWWLNQPIDLAVDSIDHLLTAALGLPRGLGTPLTFLSQRGRRRVDYDITRHWPDLLNRDHWNHDHQSK